MAKQKKPIRKQNRGLLAHHIAASLISIAPHPHTGKSLHHRHTSHGTLLLLLLLTGILLFSNLGALRAYGVTRNGSHAITVNVTGKAPGKGATITFPGNQTATKAPLVDVTGSCEASTVVATYNKGTLAGSSLCTSTGNYTNTIPLNNGENILQSENYDALNQAGPKTSQVIITKESNSAIPGTSGIPEIAKTDADITVVKNPVYTAPAPQPSENPCYTQKDVDEKIESWPTIRVTCISRNIFAGETFGMPVKIIGGQAPFALSIDWGDGLADLKSVIDDQYHTYQHVYKDSGALSVKMKTTDALGVTSFMQTVVAVNGSPAGAPSTFASIAGGFESVWSEAPVPMYWIAVTLVVGFWIGDIFHRYYTSAKAKPVKATVRRKRA